METVLQQHNIDQSSFFSSGLFATSESLWRGLGPQNLNRPGLGGRDGERANSEDKRSEASGSGHSAPPAEQASTKQPGTEDGLEETQGPSLSSAKKRQPSAQLGRTAGSADTQARGLPSRVTKQSKPKGAANSKSFVTMEQAPSEAQKREQDLKGVVQAQANPNVAAAGKRKGKRKKEEMESPISQVPSPQQTNQQDSPVVMNRTDLSKRSKTKLSGVKEAKVGVEFPANKQGSPGNRPVESQVEVRTRCGPLLSAPVPVTHLQQQPSQKPEHGESFTTHGQMPQVTAHVEESSRSITSMNRPSTPFNKGMHFSSAGNLNTVSGSKSSVAMNTHNNLAARSSAPTSHGLATGLASQNTLEYQSGLCARGVSEDSTDDSKSTTVFPQRDDKQSEILGMTGPTNRIDPHSSIPGLRSANVYTVKPGGAEGTTSMGVQVSDSHTHSFKARSRMPGALSMHTTWQPHQQQPWSLTQEVSNDSVRSGQRGVSPDISMAGSTIEQCVGEKQDPASHTAFIAQDESGWKRSPGGSVPSDRSGGHLGATDQMNQVYLFVYFTEV